MVNPWLTTRREMRQKFQFYQTYGVEEYYLYDSDTFVLLGWLRQGETLMSIPNLSGWVSPRLRIRFECPPGQDMEIYHSNGHKFLTSVELDDRAEQERQRAEQAEAKLQSVVLNLLRQGMNGEQVADLMGLSMAQLEKIQSYLEEYEDIGG